jgi:rhodanese-related sulfurtransferase
MTIATITPGQLAEKAASQPVLLIDVRTPAEFEEIHAAGARSMPLDKLDPQAIREEHPEGDVYLICRSGGRGKQACEKFFAAGIDRVVNVEGGTLAWEQAGLPVVRGRKTMSLERQVRIAAGSLVLVGAILGAFVDIGFVGLSAFVGAGLVFAGITDTCGMGMLLAKMPWNQRGPKSCQIASTVPTPVNVSQRT